MGQTAIHKWARVFAVFFTAGCAVGAARADSAPTLLNFQGRLTSPAGAPVTTAQSVRVSLFQGGTAGTSASGTLVYQEDTTVTPDANGVFTHVIGSGTPVAGQTLTEADFNTTGLPLYVELKFGAETLLPRTRLLSAAFAIEASRLDGKSASEIIGQAGGSAFGNESARSGAKLEWLSVSQVRLKSGIVGFSDGKVRKNSTARTWDFANGVGPGGLDAGVEASNTWYYLYAVPDPIDDGKFAVVASVNAPIQAGGTGPAGYGVHRYLGAVRNDSASNIRKFYRAGDRVLWEGVFEAWRSVSGSESPLSVWTVVNTGGNQPLTSTAIISNNVYDAFGASTALEYTVATSASPTAVRYLCSDWGDGICTNEMVIPTESLQFYWKAVTYPWSNNGTGQSRSFMYVGYLEDLSEF